jgi:hypothetical protein
MTRVETLVVVAIAVCLVGEVAGFSVLTVILLTYVNPCQ